eukprot:GILI01015962.1.p1 GENE.GILI01015962.1~~GILI01015962.1.p1  ORF type:complete len:328 (-),score=104.88 GILI01015962.1:117-1100(-)
MTLVKANANIVGAPPANNPFKGLSTTTVTGQTAPTGFAGFGAASGTAAPSGGFSFGAFGANAPPTAAEKAGAAAASKFSFSFGAPSSGSAAAPAPTTAATTAPQTFSFSFGASSAAPVAAATSTPVPVAAAPAAASAFNFGNKFDFKAGVQAFAAAQTAAPSAEEEEINPEEEVPITAAPHVKNALSAAAVQEAAADDSTLLLSAPNTKVFVQGFKDALGDDGKLIVSTEKEWKERGSGDLKISAYEFNGSVQNRLVLHSSQTKQLVLNVAIDKWFAVVGSTDKTVAFRTIKIENDKPKPTLYNLRISETLVKTVLDKLTELTAKKE